MLARDQRRDVFDAQQPLLSVSRQRVSAQPKLDRPARESMSSRTVVGVPLQANR